MDSDRPLFLRAYDYAQLAHGNQLDDDGRPYIEHLIQVMKILQNVTDDEEVLAAGMLHDTLEDTDTDYADLLLRFGKRVADLVLEVTHEGKGGDHIGYYFPRLKSREAILIKFADRLSNLTRMSSWNQKRQDHYLRKSKF